jgi:hypothetical protein
MRTLTIIDPDMPKRGLAQPHRPFEHCVENGAEITRRGIDNLENLGHSGLLSFGFIALASSCPKFSESVIEPPLQLRVGKP